MDIQDSVICGNYARPGSTVEMRVTGQVILEDPDNYGITRRMFHPYNGYEPIHCAAPAGGCTYHRPKGYS